MGRREYTCWLSLSYLHTCANSPCAIVYTDDEVEEYRQLENFEASSMAVIEPRYGSPTFPMAL